MFQSNDPKTASEWLLALKERPDDVQLKLAFDAWYAQDRAHVDQWQKAVKAYKLMGEVPPKFDIDWRDPGAEAFSPIDILSSISAGAGQRWAAAAVAASLLIAVFLNIQTGSSTNVYKTEVGEVQHVELADGSLVHLGPLSHLEVDYTSHSRDVRLIEGQAFFDVMSMPTRPFRVLAKETEVSVLGTSFDVSLYPDRLSVQVSEGIVTVKPDPAFIGQEVLKVGDGLDLSSDGRTVRREVSPDYIEAWMSGRLMVNHRPAQEVIDVLKRYHSGLVLFGDSDIGQQPVTGMYLLSAPDVALRAVAQSAGAEIYEISPWITIIYGS